MSFLSASSSHKATKGRGKAEKFFGLQPICHGVKVKR